MAKAFQGQKYRFVVEKNPKHTSRVVKAFLKKKESIGSQPQSVVLTSMKITKYFLGRQVKPLTKQELVDGIKCF